jgi:glyoxylase-like metal-dependent hydrolase (beta-lactamase superfamily II)
MTTAPAVTAEGEALQSARDKLFYADVEPPEPGCLSPLGGGAHWLRVPLPGELNHINLWLIDHEDGLVLIDTGMACDEARTAWQAIEAEVLKQRPLRLIVVTHLHPDHVGLAAWLQERHGVPVWMSSKTEAQVRGLLAQPTESQVAARAAYMSSHGVGDAQEAAGSTMGDKYRHVMSGAPVVARHPGDGDEVTWGGVTWRFIEVGGHAAGHLCLHAPAQNLLIAGDQILPTISPNVSLHEATLDANPLASYLASLDRLAELDAQTLVLPSHGRPFFGLRTRAADLGSHHREKMEKLKAACVTPLTAVDVLPVMYSRPLRGFQRFLALGEAIAHLEYMAATGMLQRQVDGGGVVRFAAAGGPS